MARSKKEIEYSGALKTPIGIEGVAISTAAKLTPSEELEIQQRHNESAAPQFDRQCRDKIPLLMRHFNIENESDYLSLALALAKAHVPGFARVSIPMQLEHGDGGRIIKRKTKNSGRPLIWTEERLSHLLASVARYMTQHRISKDREALTNLASHGEWSRPAGHPGDLESWIETLESRLQDAKKLETKKKRHEEGGKRLLRLSDSARQKRAPRRTSRSVKSRKSSGK